MERDYYAEIRAIAEDWLEDGNSADEIEEELEYLIQCLHEQE